jgi:uncharacterized ubiquitin-like protein YukD
MDDLAIEFSPLIKKRKFIETQLLDLANTDPSSPSKSIKEWIMDSLHEHLDPLIEEQKKINQFNFKKLDELEVAMTKKKVLKSLIESLKVQQKSTIDLMIRLRNQLSSEETKLINIELELREYNNKV